MGSSDGALISRRLFSALEAGLNQSDVALNTNLNLVLHILFMAEDN